MITMAVVAFQGQITELHYRTKSNLKKISGSSTLIFSHIKYTEDL